MYTYMHSARRSDLETAWGNPQPDTPSMQSWWENPRDYITTIPGTRLRKGH